MSNNIHHFEVNNINLTKVSLSDFKGKTLLIVNVASACGFTPQYTGLQALYEKYKDQGLEILAFPCNQFGKQEPGTSEEIQDFCDSNYKVTFPLSEKIEVNGNGAHPLYKYLKKELKGKLNDSVKWNFTKFLINRNGEPSQRFSSTVEPEDIKPFIDNLI